MSNTSRADAVELLADVAVRVSIKHSVTLISIVQQRLRAAYVCAPRGLAVGILGAILAHWHNEYHDWS